MAIQQPPQTYVNIGNDPGLVQQQIAIAKRDGGLTVFQTTKDIYVTAVEERVTYQQVKNITNNPGGNTDGEVQFYQNGKFQADSDFKYDQDTDTLILAKLQTSAANLGPVDNLTITGGVGGQVLSTDGSGVLQWIDNGGGSSTYGNANVASYLPVYGGNVAANVVTAARVQSLAIQSTGNVTGVRFIGDGGWLSNIPAANIVGNIGNANVAGPNASVQFNNDGVLGGIAGFTVSTSTSTVTAANLAVTGTLSAAGNNLSNIQGANVVGAVALATVATTAYSVDAANVVGTVALATVATHSGTATVANSVAGANVTGQVALATLATTATTAGTANSVAGANVVGAVAISTTAGTVTTAAQSNITSVGTLTSLSVSGTTNLGAVANVTITGGTTGQVLTTDGGGGLSWQTTAPTYGNADVAAYLPTYTGNLSAGNIVLAGTTSRIESAGTIAVLPSLGNTVDLGTTRLLGDITPVNAQGGNVGTAALPFFEGHFVNVVGDNIIGDGGNLANITAANITGVVANAAHAVLATSAEQIDGGNVYGEVLFAATANTVAGSNVSGVVANAQHAVTSDAADFVSNAVQANITQVGTLIDLMVTGDATAGGLISTGDIVATGNATVGNIAAGNAQFTGTGSFGGNVDMAGFAVTDVADPLLPQDAATKFYVDTLASTGISYHTAVAAATTTTLAVASAGTVAYNNGTDGVGATLTTTGSFTLIDGVNITTPGTRVLVKNEANAATNGVYTFTNATTLTRSSDTDEYGTGDNTVLRENAYFFVSGGSTNIGTAFVCSTKGVIVFGTTAILFSQFSTSQVYSAGTGLTLTNTSFGVNPLQPTITQVGTLATLAVTGNITGGNATVSGVVTATGNVVGGNLRTTGLVTATGNVTGGNLTTAGRMVATGNVTGGNLTTAGVLSVTGNANIGNIDTATLTANGNITAAGVFTGNGSGLTNIAGANIANYAGNVTVATQPNITSVGTLTTLAVAGNITGGNIAVTSNIAASNIALNGQIVTPNITVTNRAILGDVANVRIGGGNATEFLTTDGLGSLSWASPLPQIGPDVTANLDFYPLFALANTGPLAEVYTSAAGFRYNPNTGTLTTGGLEMSNITADVGNITVVNSSTVNAGTLNGSTVNGTNVVTPTVTAKTAAIEIKSLGVGDIKFTTVTGNVTMTNPTLFKNLLDPDQPQDAATKHYTDAIAQGLDPLVNARVATTDTLAAITGGTVTYDNGVDGVGATLTLSAPLTTVDGVTLADGNRILVHLEADPATNGVYVRTSSTVLTRAADNDDNTELVKGNFVFMAEGILYGKVGLAQTEVVTTVGTDPVNWVQFAAAPNYVAGAGIYITGAEIKVDNTGVTAGSYGGSGSIPVLNINSRGQITSASVSGISAPAGGLTGNRIHSNVFYSNLQTVGTLENLTVAGDTTLAGNILSFGSVTVANADLGNLAIANFFQGDGGLLSNINVNLNKIDNGTSELVVDPNAAVRAVIDGDAIMSVTTSGLDITGAITATTSITAPDFIGVASSANTADTASQVIDATQSNITAVGTLTSLDVSGVTTLGNVGNVKITGGTNGQILRTDGTGNLVWATITATTAATVTTAAQPNITSVGTLTSLAVTGNISGANITGAHYGAGNNLSNIQGANVSGAVAFATTANTVAGANVTGEVAFAAVANSIAGANVVGAVALSTATNAVDGANVFGQVANALLAGTVYEAAQPNITSVGTLTGLTVDGDITTTTSLVNVAVGGNTWTFKANGALTLPGSTYDASSPIGIRGDYGIILHPSHNTGGTGPELSISYNDGIEITPITNDYLAGGTRAAPLYIQGAYSTTTTVVPGSVFISPGRNTTDATYGNVSIGSATGGIVKLLGDQIRLGPVNTLSIDGGNPGDVLTTDAFSGLSWTPMPVVAGFPTLPNYADDAAATTAAGTPSLGMMYYDTTLETAKVYKTAGWTAI